MADPIYLIQYKGQDYDGRDTWITEEGYGYFTSQEAAQAWIEKREAFEARYGSYLREIEIKNRDAQAQAEALAAAWDNLKAQGISPGFFRPTLPARQTTPTEYEEWKSRVSQYSFTEVDPA